jgi:general stress protein CsbA
MNLNEHIVNTSGPTYPPIFIAAVGYIMYVFVYTETKKNKKGEAASRGKWIAFFLAQVIIGAVVIGEWGESTFIPTLVVVLLEYTACYVARVIAIKSSDKS